MLYIPNKVLNGEALSVQNYAFWEYDDGSGDPYIQGGVTPRAYQWKYTINILPQSHSSHLTRLKNLYNGNDIDVGDWIASKSNGTALKIVAIENKTDSQIVAICEDVFRHNTFRSPAGSGTGSFSVPSEVMIFSISKDNEPLLDLIPSGTSTSFYPNLSSRLKSLPLNGYQSLSQEGNNFEIDDMISVDTQNNQFVKYSVDNPYIVGRVVEKGPDEDGFFISSLSKIEEFDKSVSESDVGDIVYIDNSGNYTLSKSGLAAFICLREETNTFLEGTSINPTTESGNVIILNNNEITTTDGTMADLIAQINSAGIGITAGSNIKPTVVGKNASLAFPRVAAYVSNSPSVEINGVTVVFTTTTAGDVAVPGIQDLAVEEDIVADINNANIPNVEARVISSEIEIVHTEGGTIELVNIQSDNNGNPIFSVDSGSSSATGIVADIYGPSSDYIITLENDGAGAIDMVNKNTNTSNILDDFGIYTVENGTKALMMNIQQGIRRGDVYSVLDNTQRLQLDVIVSDSAYVEDGGNGEWQYWLYTSSGWELIATEDSARTDADVLSLSLSNSDSGTNLVGTVSNNSRVTNVTVEVTEAFDDIDSVLNIGDSSVNDRLMSEDIIDLTEIGTYTFTPSYVYDDGGDTDLNAYLDAATSTTGQLKIIISYS